ncbi:NAD(P)-binding protein, partial [Basidiobolus meristosporus CBS 931.73]
MEKDNRASVATQDTYCVIGIGFVGSYILKALLSRGEKSVYALDLREPTQPILEGEKFEFRKVDTTDRANVNTVLRAISEKTPIHSVFLTAGIIEPSQRLSFQYSKFYQTNVKGAQNVAEVCEQLGVARLIYTSSSTVVIGKDIKTTTTNEDDRVTQYPVNHYSATKILGEKIILQMNGKKRPNEQSESNTLFSTACIRPGGIFGAGDKYIVDSFCQKIASGATRIIQGGANFISEFVYIENVVHAHLLLDGYLRDEPCRFRGETFFITNCERMTNREFSQKMIEATSISNIRFQFLSVWILWVIAYFSEFLQWVLRNRVSLGEVGILTPATVHLLCHNYNVSCEKARLWLGYKP